MERGFRFPVEAHIGAPAIGTIPYQHLFAAARKCLGKFAHTRRLLREASTRRYDDGVTFADDFVLDPESIDGDSFCEPARRTRRACLFGRGFCDDRSCSGGPIQKRTSDSDRAQDEGFTARESLPDAMPNFIGAAFARHSILAFLGRGGAPTLATGPSRRMTTPPAPVATNT